MKSAYLTAAILALGLGAIYRAPADLATDAPPPFVGNHYEGIISQLSPNDETGTITTRFGDRSLPFKATADTHIWKTQITGPKSLAVGNMVMVIGKPGKTQDELDAYVIDVIPAIPQATTNRQPKRGMIYGTIASITPISNIGDEYTLSERSGRTVTLHNPGNVLIGQTIPGTFDDLDTGGNVKLDGTLSDGTFIVTRIVVQPNLNGARRAGKLGVGKKQNQATAVAPVTTPAATDPTMMSSPTTSPSTTPAAPPNPITSGKLTDDDFGLGDLSQ